MTNISIKEFISLNKMEIDSSKVQEYIDILEQELQLITNKYKKENNIFKLYYTLNYPLEKCYTMIKLRIIMNDNVTNAHKNLKPLHQPGDHKIKFIDNL
ncbi:hypothetical protein [Borreliella bavariensis]|uniref:hypothetical protein n=1 Tax=Borreliella bavariensis TaxID=664662 RepID=UPI001C024EDF|nr:hypothetical protein [Borreliella bavariensis]